MDNSNSSSTLPEGWIILREEHNVRGYPGELPRPVYTNGIHRIELLGRWQVKGSSHWRNGGGQLHFVLFCGHDCIEAFPTLELALKHAGGGR